MPAAALSDLPDGVLEHLFHNLLDPPAPYILSGRSVARLPHAFALAHASSRFYGLFRPTLRTLHLHASDHPHLDHPSPRLASLLSDAAPFLRHLSIKWFHRPPLHPILSALARAPHLVSLSLHGLPHRAAAPALHTLLRAVAPRLHNLSLVSLACFDHFGSAADDALAAVAACCPDLRHVELGNARGISHYALVRLFRATASRLQSLHMFNLTHFSLGDHTLHGIVAHCRLLCTLNITAMSGVTRHGLRHVCHILAPSLREVCFETHELNAGSVDDDTVMSIVAQCRQLESVCFSKPLVSAPWPGGEELSVRSVSLTYRVLAGSLRRLSVFGPKGLLDTHLVELADRCAMLSSIGLRSCDKITSAGVAVVARKLGTQLQSIDLSGSHGIDDDALSALGRYCGQGLEFLWAADLPLLTMRGVIAMLRGAGKSIRDLNLSKNPGLDSMPAADAIRKYCKGPMLENLILDNVAGEDCHYEIARHVPGEMDSNFSRHLERVREACQNVIIMLEADCIDLPELMDMSDMSEIEIASGGQAGALTVDSVLDGFLNMHQGVLDEMED